MTRQMTMAVCVASIIVQSTKKEVKKFKSLSNYTYVPRKVNIKAACSL